MRDEDISKLVGKRVRVHRATHGLEHALWNAGAVAVGSTGTIVDAPVGVVAQIKWDHGQKPVTGYFFGVSTLDHELEEITDEGP